MMHIFSNSRRNRPALVAASVLVLLLLFPISAWTGNFRVFPLRLEFDAKAKSGVFNLMNEGEGELRLQLEAREWTQDEEGKDTYTETSDIVFYPKILTIEKGGKRIVRVGIKRPPAETEKTYRLFMEEIPARREGEGTKVAIAVRLGVPIFLEPSEAEPRGGITDGGLSRGELGFTVRNTGNAHFMIKSIGITGRNAEGAEVFSGELDGWYLLGGVSRPYAISVPGEVCADVSTFDIRVETDGFRLTETVDVDKSGCSQ